MEYKGINDNQVTVNAALSVGLINNARKGEHDLGKKAADKILNFYQDLNRVWLLTGEGDMINDNNKTPMDRKPPLVRILDILNEKGYSLNSFDALTGKKFLNHLLLAFWIKFNPFPTFDYYIDIS